MKIFCLANQDNVEICLRNLRHWLKNCL